jgi:WD40 repeat protein
LSYNGRDGAVVERLARWLKAEGLEPWLDRWSLTAGAEWQRELAAGLDGAAACAVFVGPHDLGAWELQELAVALDRAARERSFRVFPVLLPGVGEPFEPNRLPHFLRTRTWVDLRRGDEDARGLEDLVNAVKGLPFGADVPADAGDVPVEAVVPYRGLRAFGEEDAGWFFGRDGEIQRLVEKLKISRFLAVLGPSGSGKSSLVRAGLIPRLRGGALAGSERWQVLVLRPGAAPLTALAAQLAKLQRGEAMQATVDRLAQDARSLHLSVELGLADRPAVERVVVVVDQLEEVFTLCHDESQRRQLFVALLYATSAAGGRTVVVVTLRADFYARCAVYPELAQLLAAQQMLVGPMQPAGLRQAIEEPTRRAGLTLEEGLSDTILTDAGAEPGALPLLQHALLELWTRRRGAVLTFEGYRQAGGVHGALAQRAEQIYAELTGEQQQTVRRILLRLTLPGEGAEDTRRRAPRSELASADAGAGGDFDDVLARLVDARLLTTGRDETGVEVVDVSHEALVRGWPRLRAWIDADRQGLRVHRRLTDATAEWARLRRDASALYRGVRLGEAQEWAIDHVDDLSQLERDFLKASHTADQRRTRLRALVAGVVALSAIAAALAVWALDQRSNTRAQARQTESLALTLTASPLRGKRPDLALLLAFEGYHTSPRAEARSGVISALLAARDPGITGILHGHAAAVVDVAFSRDGRTLATASSDNTVRLWDAATHKQTATLKGHTYVNSVAFSRDGRTLATASFDKTVRLWDAATHKQTATLKGHTDTVNRVTFSPNGRTLATASADKTVRLWDAATHKQTATLKGHTDTVNRVTFSPNGRTLATASFDTTVRLWDAATHKQTATLKGHTDTVNSVTFSPNGRTLATASFDKTVRLWDAATHKQTATLKGHTDAVNSVAFSRDGRTLATASFDKTVRLWDAATHKQTATLKGHTNTVNSVTFSPNGRTLATASFDKTVRLWDAATHKQTATLKGHTDAVNSVAFSRDGSTLATASEDKTVRLWDAATHKQTATLKGHTNGVYSVAFSRDGSTLATASEDKTVRLWDAATHKQTATLKGHTDAVISVAFSRDGRTLATASTDKTVRLWDAATHKQTATLKGHTDAVISVAFSRDGRTLATASADKTVRLWDAATHKQTATLKGHTGAVNTVAFSPNGRTLATASLDKTVRLWTGVLWRNFAELKTEICHLVGSGMSKSEWMQYATGIPYRNSCR